jgi:glycine hydroxymethyltransferase
MIPNDLNGPWYTSGLRLGTPAVTTLGMGEGEMKAIASTMTAILSNTVPVATKSGNTKVKYSTDLAIKQKAQTEIKELLDRFPLYPEIDIEFLTEYFSSKVKTVISD